MSLLLVTVLLLVGIFSSSASAAFINFENCLDPNVVNSNPLQLQFIPLQFWAAFNTTDPGHNLNVTVYGNVSGKATQQPYPAPNDPQWSNPTETLGKIVNLSIPNNKYSTLFAKFNVLSYTPYDASPSRFCGATVHGECPLGPVFYANSSDPSQLPAFSVSHDFYSTYSFTTLTSTLRITSGDVTNADLACISASITPDIGHTLRNLLTYLPLVVLLLVGFATASAAIWSPWGTTDTFRWTSNYGRDEDLLRLVTPGFGDCLQYIQFIILTGSLSLNYPGYYQPVVSQVSWSALMFNQSFVSHGNGTQSPVDGIYNVNGTYGLDRMSQLVGMTATKDIWTGMLIWLLVILAGVGVFIQLGFAFRWVHRQIGHIPEEDLRAKNLPFTMGNAVRIVFNYFLLPVVSLSMFQLVIASKSPAFAVGLSALLLVALIGFAARLLYLVASTRPRSFLFDDLPTVLTYGPLYNTFSDDAATFALIPVLLTFIRGIAIGAVQPSGIAQLVLLAICEVILALTLNAFRPFHSPTSMNAYHTFFAIVRFLTILLSVAFVPSLGVTEGPRGWIGYVILLMHAIVLVFGFFLNATQTLIEVIARQAGAGGEGTVGGGAARGRLVKVFGMRQLSRRVPRRDTTARHSMTSDAAMLGPESDQKSIQLEGSRVRSLSGSSAQLLNRPGASDGRGSLAFESSSAQGFSHSRGSGSGPYTPTTPRAESALSIRPGATLQVGEGSPNGGIIGLKQAETADPYYRPPRQRRATLDALDTLSPAARSRGSWASGGDWVKRRFSHREPEPGEDDDPMEGPSISGRGAPLPAYLGSQKADSDYNVNDPRRSKTDYAVREVDFYYGVRGPALSNMGTRRLKTGPADPTGPVSSATGWFRGLFGGKTKDKGKGFEVVRSARAPPPGMMLPINSPPPQDPYRDDPEAARTEEAGIAELSNERRGQESEEEQSDLDSDEGFDASNGRQSQIAQFPPYLPAIDTGGGIELPSRMGSKSSKISKGSIRKRPPAIPRKSSRRQSSLGVTDFKLEEPPRLAAIAASPPPSPQAARRLYDQDDTHQRHLSPSASASGRLPFGSNEPVKSSRLSTGAGSSSSSILQTADEENINPARTHHARHSSSALGTLAPDIRNDRPSSMGYVQQHRATDNIHQASPDSPTLVGSTAEFVGVPSRRNGSAA